MFIFSYYVFYDKLKLLFLIGLLFLSVLPVNAEDRMEYKHITNSTGLSNSAINCILQDSSKIMWFGSWDGLNSFNGKEFRVYKPELGNVHAISNNVIRDIIEEKNGIIWLSTDHGLNRMNIEKSTFTCYYFGYEKTYPAIPNIFRIAKTTGNQIICAVLDWGLSCFDEATQDFVLLDSPIVNTMDIREIKIDKNNNIWALHRDGRLGTIKLGKDKNNKPVISDSKLLELPQIRSLYDCGKYMIALDLGKKLHIYSPYLHKIGEYELEKYMPNAEIVNVSIIRDLIYVTISTGGYYTLSTSLDSYPVYNESLRNIPIKVFYESDQDIIWAGTDGAGIFMIYNSNKPFKTIYPKKEFNMVRAFCEDNQKRLWIGSKGGGVAVMNNYMNQPNLLVEYNESNGLLNNSVYALTRGFGGDIFIGSDGLGLNVFMNNKMTKLDTDIVPFVFSGIYSIYCSKHDSTLWLGTSEYGLIRLKVQKNNTFYKVIDYSHYLHDRNHPKSLTNNVIYSIVPENDSVLWIGTRGGGLNKFHIHTENFESYQYDPENALSLSSNDILSLYKDKNGLLWIGTSVGLNTLTYDEDGNVVIRKYSQSHGLPNNTVHGIIEDHNKNIWISTNRGLAKISPSSGDVIPYYERDGLQNNEFSDGAYYKSQYNDYIFFGGIMGLNVFNPEQIQQRDYAPTFNIVSFKIFNKEENIYNRLVTEKNGNEQLVLNYNENFFSFNFQSVDYIHNENCEYKYMLSGFDMEWITTGNMGSATYTNIKPGRYTLLVAYTNGDKVWVNEPYELAILIKPPFWASIGAYIVYSILIVLLLYLAFLIIQKRLRENRKLLIERLERKEQENIHEAKLRFFTNIAHEFYTPITLIYGPCEKILEKSGNSEYIIKYVNVIMSNAKRMKHLISELMEFRKMDTGHLQIVPQKVNITELLNNIGSNFSEIAEENKIDYRLQSVSSDVNWVSDSDAMEKIIFNIISNAFKYTPKNGYIQVEYFEKNDKLNFKIMNSGKGIKPENIDVIFDRFRILDDFENQMEKGHSGRNGIGLALTKSLVTLLNGSIKVESIINESTTFTIKLPQLKELSRPEFSLKAKGDKAGANESEQAAHSPVPVQWLSTKEGDGPLILIVDDEKDIRSLLRDTIGEIFPNIIEASNGVEALQLMKTKSPNLIICDIMMPEMDGITFAKELKNNAFTNHLPIVFLSAKNSIDDQIMAAESGSDIYITKPFHPKYVLATVENILAKQQLIHDYYNSSANTYEMLENGNVVHSEDKEFLMKIIRFIEDHIEEEELSSEFISNNLGISKMTLYRKIKSILNQTPGEFVKSVKLNKSATLLLSTNMTVQEIMYRCGFINKSYFYKEFARVYKGTPKEYREREKMK